MKIYLEIVESFVNADGVSEIGQSVKIDAKTKDDAISLLPIYEPSFIGKTYIKKIHYCNHDETGRVIGCTEEVL